MENIENIKREIVRDNKDFALKRGVKIRDDDRGMSIMLDYFSKDISREMLINNMKIYNIDNLFLSVKKKFAEIYDFYGEDISLNNLFQGSVGSNITSDKGEGIWNVIHIDELFEASIISFLLLMFKWTKELENEDVFGSCFLYVLYVMNEMCIMGDMQTEEMNRKILETIRGDIQVLQIAENCYWTITAFNIAHEMSHVYLNSIGKYTHKMYEENDKYARQEEYEADEIAYNIVLKMIEEAPKEDLKLERYTYLAPIMCMDYFDMIYYTDRVLYKKKHLDSKHPEIKKRKANLFNIANRLEFDFSTTEGNVIYNGFLDVYDKYKDELLLKMERGKLASILRK